MSRVVVCIVGLVVLAGWLSITAGAETVENCKTQEEVQQMLDEAIKPYERISYTWRGSGVQRDKIFQCTTFSDSESTVTVCDDVIYSEVESLETEYKGWISSSGPYPREEKTKRYGVMITPEVSYYLNGNGSVTSGTGRMVNGRREHLILLAYRIEKNFARTSETLVLISDYLKEEPFNQNFRAMCSAANGQSQLTKISGGYAETLKTLDGRQFPSTVDWAVNFAGRAQVLPQEISITRTSDLGSSSQHVKVLEFAESGDVTYPQTIAGWEVQRGSKPNTLESEVGGTVTLTVKATGRDVKPVDVQEVLARWIAYSEAETSSTLQP